MLAGTILGAGCATQHRYEPVVIGAPSMLFDRPGALFDSTRFGRNPWPATIGPLQSVEETVFVDYYRDYQGSAFQEDTNPQRRFRSYRVGTLIR